MLPVFVLVGAATSISLAATFQPNKEAARGEASGIVASTPPSFAGALPESAQPMLEKLSGRHLDE
jgi:hypothetical protein